MFDKNENVLLGWEAVERMWQRHSGFGSTFSGDKYCLGWIGSMDFGDAGGEPLVRWHAGDYRGTYAFMVYRSDGICFAGALTRDRSKKHSIVSELSGMFDQI